MHQCPIYYYQDTARSTLVQTVFCNISTLIVTVMNSKVISLCLSFILSEYVFIFPLPPCLSLSLASSPFFALLFRFSLFSLSLLLCGPKQQQLRTSFHFTYQAIYVSKVREQGKHCHVRDTVIWHGKCKVNRGSK